MKSHTYFWLFQVYASPLKGGARAVVLFNRHHPEYPFNNMSVHWSQLGYADDAKAVVRDLYAEEDIGTFTGKLNIQSSFKAKVSSDTRPIFTQAVTIPLTLSCWGINLRPGVEQHIHVTTAHMM